MPISKLMFNLHTNYSYYTRNLSVVTDWYLKLLEECCNAVCAGWCVALNCMNIDLQLLQYYCIDSLSVYRVLLH